MTASSIDIDTLSALVPLNALNRDNLTSLMNNAQVLRLDAGETLFEAGDTDRRTLYLLMGEIRLTTPGSREDELLCVSHEESGYPIGPCHPRQQTATAVTDIEVISFDSATLDIMLTWDQEADSYEVEEHNNEDSDWMMRMLNNKAFYDVPPANIHTVFTKMEPVEYKAGDVVIHQGDVGDYFYAIQSGRCEIVRETPRQPEGVKLVELSAGDTFGEEALISDSPRNATVTMLSDGILVRLDKNDFITLLTAPILYQLSLDEAKQQVSDGGVWLDVRLPSEFGKMHIKDSINIPLYFLRKQIHSLDPDIPYVVVCDAGSRSSAGAFLLKERGFNAMVLKGGLSRAGARKG